MSWSGWSYALRVIKSGFFCKLSIQDWTLGKLLSSSEIAHIVQMDYMPIRKEMLAATKLCAVYQWFWQDAGIPQKFHHLLVRGSHFCGMTPTPWKDYWWYREKLWHVEYSYHFVMMYWDMKIKNKRLIKRLRTRDWVKD